MKSTQTGIAIALAVIVVGIFLIVPGLSPFNSSTVTTTTSTTTPTITTNQIATTTMPLSISTSTPIVDNGQLQITDDIVGTGVAAGSGDTVTVNYIGALTNGTVFDASADHGTSGFSFVLGAGQVIKGWDQGVVGMKVGGERRLVIPAALAYGSQAVGGVIPANSTLIFEVQLLSVQPPPAQ